MLIRRPQVRVYPKMMLSPQGEWVYALIVVAEYNGQVRVKVVFPEKTGQSTLALNGECTSPYALCGEVGTIVAEENTNRPNKPVASPYQDFSFTTCQQTRAPNQN